MGAANENITLFISDPFPVHATMTSVVLPYWVIAARAGFANPADWRAWADKLIVSMPAPPFWLISISLAMNVTELRKALKDVNESFEGVTPTVVDDALIGYIWLRFERQEINLWNCLNLIGQAADASCSSIECESVYALLNDLEAHSRNDEYVECVEVRAKELLAPLRRLAEEQWAEIQSYA